MSDPTTRNLRRGWLFLLIYLSLGIFLEALHGLKAGWYLDVSQETRRTLWTLAHTHGTLLGLVHLALAFTLTRLPGAVEARWPQFASTCLTGATILMPAGFFLGGLTFYQGDPGLGIVLVPVGAALLFIAVAMTAWNARGGTAAPAPEPTGEEAPAPEPPAPPTGSGKKKRKKR